MGIKEVNEYHVPAPASTPQGYHKNNITELQPGG